MLAWLRPRPCDHQRILDAIRQVESSGRLHPPDGDGGRAIGPFQIWRVYWQDAVEHDPSLRGGTYQDCRDLDYAQWVVEAYMQRYAREAWEQCDFEIIARVHNGGPTGARKAATLPYWRKVQRALRRGSD